MEKSRDHSTWIKGVVHWFDDASGEGLVKALDGQTYFVHYSAISSKTRHKTLTEKQPVKFKLVKDTTFAQVSHIKEI